MTKLKNIVFYLIFLNINLCSFAQVLPQNFITNGSFDSLTHTDIATYPNLKDQYAEWDEYLSYGGFAHTNTNPPLAPYSPGNAYQIPQNGVGYYCLNLIVNVMNLDCVGEGQSYVQCKLKRKLKENKIYRGRFYASLWDSMDIATSRIGMHISSNKPLPTYLLPNQINPFINATPQIHPPFGNAITDKINWTKVEDTFKASANMQYMTLGNFYRANQTDTLRVSNYPNNGGCYTEGAIYYIDNLSLVEEDRAVAYFDTTKKSLCLKQGIPKVLGDTAVRPWLQYEWKNKNGLVISNNRTFTYNAALLENTYFTVRIIDTGEYAFVTKAIDTIFVNVSIDPSTVGCPPVGLEEVLADAEQIDMFYNDGAIKFNELHERFAVPSSASPSGTAGTWLVLKSIDGKLIYKTKLERKKYNYTLDTELQKGFYFVEIVYEGQGIRRKKIIIE
jgi:hypothetical protein